MPLQFDPEFLKVLEPLIPQLSGPGRPKLTIEGIKPAREGREATIAAFFGILPDSSDVEQTVHHLKASDGYLIEVHSFSKNRAGLPPGPAILHFHAGGMILGKAQIFAKRTALLASRSSVPIFSVNYRLAPEFTGATAVEDCYAALAWLHQNAEGFNIDPSRIAVFGESAGGGLAAGVTLLARDRDLQPPLAKQILVYPMLDDQNMMENESMKPFAFWTTEDNIVAWTALLGEKAGKPEADISQYVVPARAQNLAGLPPAYIDVGGLDIFRNEDITYATRLLAENITTEFHLYPGLPHGFEMIAPYISTTQRAFENRVKAMQSF
jgi:acetyl esterase/lipase